jgi:hypothetical protein
MTTQPSPRAGSLALTHQPASQHPAYWPLFDAYAASAQNATRALAVLAEQWDVEVLGPLPSERTARHWAKADAWDRMILDAVDANWEHYHRQVSIELRMTAPLAVNTIRQVLAGTYPEPKMASAAVRAALDVLTRCGIGKDSLIPTATETVDPYPTTDLTIEEIVEENNRLYEEYRQTLGPSKRQPRPLP